MNANKLQQFERELKSRISTLASIKQQIDPDKKRKRGELQNLASNTTQRIAQDLTNHAAAQTMQLRERILVLRESVRKNFDFKDSTHYGPSLMDPMQTYDENYQELHRLLNLLQDMCQGLNELSFDEQDPPRHYTIENLDDAEFAVGDFQQQKKLLDKIKADKASKILSLCNQVIYRLDRLEEIFSKESNYGGYKTEIPNMEQQLYREYCEQVSARWRKAVKDNLLTETESFSYDIFHELDDQKEASTPDLENGSLSFKENILLGEKCIPIARKNSEQLDMDIAAESEVLQRHVKKGVLHTPFILDLKCNPHLFINIQGSEASDTTINFIHEYIQTMLMSQPSGRVNMCLVDFNDQCKFNCYTVLRKKVNPNALLKGIVRNEREIESVLADMENLMFDISDNKLSYNGVSDIFEYNQTSPENPQNLHVMVLMDFPEKYSPESIGHIAKVLSNGADCGIYALIVNNDQAQIDVGSRQQNVSNAIDLIKKKSIVLHEHEDGYIFASSLSATSDVRPTSLLPSCICTTHSFKNEIYPVLEKNAEKQVDQVISLAPFFELSRQFRAINDEKNDFSRMLEIPIGKNGGEVQCLRFFTDSGNAHALVIGGTGSGKSNLLHTIILSACYRYSPDELNIYLVDFKGGVEFKFYQANKVVADQLPHIRLTGLTSEPEDGVAILTNIRRFLREREDLFRRNDVEDIIAYNAQRSTDQKLPRILVIIDEVQELMTNQRLAEQALDILGELFKKGRAFGISILWASQTVPKGVAGFKDKVLSQISNRICLKVNNVDDAADLGFDAKKIRLLNRPEKGIGIIFDGLDEIDFRVAYAADRENRRKYVHEINNHWANSHKTPLFIVGDDEVPNAVDSDTIFNRKLVQVSKSNDKYNAYLGQNYVTGDPYLLPFVSRGSGEHCWIAGKNVEVLRDVLGYSFLSMIMEHETNKDVIYNEPVKFYSFNGELMNDNRDLYCVLPRKFPRLVKEVDISNITKVMIELYRIRKARAASPSTNHTPIYFFIHQFQQLAELLANTTEKFAIQEEMATAVESQRSNPEIALDSQTTSGLRRGLSSDIASSGSVTPVGNKMTFAQIFNELLHYGSEAGIHFIMTVNNPAAIPEVKAEMAKFVHKIVLEGISSETISPMVGVHFVRDLVPTKEGVAFHYTATGLSKFKTYRYDPEDIQQVQWLDGITQFE